MKAVLIGYGEIGRGVYDVFSEYHDIEIHDYAQGHVAPRVDYDIMLVAIPSSGQFIDIVLDYKATFRCENVLVFSTVPIGTCRSIGAVHCPVEGRHPDLAESIGMTDKWLGGYNEAALDFLDGFQVTVLEYPDYTEFLKLRSTTLYGLNIEFARYSKRICDDLGLDFENVKEWDRWVNGIADHFGMEWAQRYILDPPEGKKGGHCVTPNAFILNLQYPDALVERVAEL